MARRLSLRDARVAGGALALLFFLPFVLQWQNAYYTVHDNLDSVFVAFAVLGKSGHVFSFSNAVLLPDVMGAIPRNAYPGGLHTLTWLFAVLPPFAALFIQFVLVRVVAVAGTFLLLDRHLFAGQHRWMSGALAAAFAATPFWGIYPAMALAGLPFVAFALLEVATTKRRALPMLVLALYGLSGALVYVGIFLVALAGVVFLATIRRNRQVLATLVALCVLGTTSIIADLNLFVLWFARFASHRAEYGASGAPGLGLVETLVRAAKVFLFGTYYARYFAVVPLAVAVIAVASNRDDAVPLRHSRQILLLLLGSIAAFSVIYGIAAFNPVVQALQARGGVLAQWQWGRVFTLNLLLWLLVFAVSVVTLLQSQHHWKRRLAVGMVAAQLGGTLALNTEWRVNMSRLAGANREMRSFAQYFSTARHEQVAAAIGAPRDSYRVASVGFQPEIAAFNGFRTVDGYQRMYALSYKHAFRRVIAPELERSESTRRYFDDWGNRCYIFASELSWDPETIPNIPPAPINLYIDSRALSELGARYVFSAAPIRNAAELRMKLRGTFPERSADPLYLYQLQ